ncbi:hypothetical protein LTR10_022478 [Elasticomyces elasticus]|uniref:PAS domain-containing protein n=1 Tax=Exophiala sideris TaxID=1016849 RepID=A0ABR0J1V1_9EURO|nr:hypothetical protein LTR10_022478 [Elasticomyces elasticus]KAK5024382.1 hypothetical protein LTS07_008673 [Exophiala sideris]KAK5030936.1 hypothetical protein LTR13_007949 [Exophiala sideris]KAK5054115.1 hypothetical protein LTR69_009077 [Exophiala sideris]KAK5179529.1 hypothetical protein LTR44_008045 [Eurotiomycetes sp. CCFEE 6388]
METVFITIHDLSLDARIKYCSDSIEDILGYLPNEVVGRSCWEYFHPEEIPFAREIHGRGISLDKAAVLNYCRVRHRDGSWIGCECVFTVVHDVLVASTAIYRRGPKARQRALDGAGIRRIFSSSPRDPRYHMLSYLSNKFYQEPSAHLPEPRAALFLNRFTRTSTIMYATNGVSSILGLQPNDMVGKSFYECIEANCLQDAIKCLESAKANDSIAYLRFWYRNPLQQTNGAHSEIMPDDESDEDEEGGVPLRTGLRSESSVSMTDASTPRANEPANHVDGETSGISVHGGRSGQATSQSQTTQSDSHLQPPGAGSNVHRTSSDNSTFTEGNESDAVFDRPVNERRESSQTPPEDFEPEHVEIEAVVSCTSDGLVVILRRARPLVPHTLGATEAPYYANGLFASPWAPEPVFPQNMQDPTMAPLGAGPGAAPIDDSDTGFMAAIRDVAVFAWSLTGINGSLAQYAHGHASGEAVPLGMPVWDPNAKVDEQSNDLYNGFLGSVHRQFEGMDEPAKLEKKDSESTSSEDEVVWKRTTNMPPWRRPKRRAHGDAFGDEGHDGVDGENQHGGRKKATRSYTGSGSASASSGFGSGSGPSSGSGEGSGAGSASDSV